MQQLTIPFSATTSYHLDEFIVSSSNHYAYTIIQQWPNNWGVLPYPFCILLYGPKSSGKTHITKIWQQTANAFTLSRDDALSPLLLELYDAFIIEDIELNWLSQDILHYINFFNENKKYLLITTSNSLNNFTLHDLTSRINSILKLTIAQPDDQLMQILIFKYFSNYSINLSEQVLNFLLAHLPREFDQMIYLLTKVNSFALEHRRNITVPLIKEVIKKA